MPMQQTQTDREEILAILADDTHYLTGLPNFLDRNYYLDDAALKRYVRPGLILAQESTTNKYVPYNASALYGTGSDTAVGILKNFQDATNEDPAIAPIIHGKVIEAHCYVWGTAIGTIAAGIKTNLDDIHWV